MLAGQTPTIATTGAKSPAPAGAWPAAPVWLLAAIVSAGPAVAPAMATGAVVPIAPHRAVYDITLAGSKAGSGVGEVMGRMVYEISGSACEGYTQNMRFVTRMAGAEGNSVLSDMRSSTWEDGKGERFRFQTSQIRDEKTPETTVGDAKRSSGGAGIAVEINRPETKALNISFDTIFPMQHTIGLIEAARQGKSVYAANLYDGSEKGEKIYATTAVIGKRLPPGANAKLPKAKSAEPLDKIAAWPVSISYFDKDKSKEDAVPDYELAFIAFENGVSRKLFIDYGEFAIRGALTEIDFLEPSKCDSPK